jgi:hypothetical protein
MKIFSVQSKTSLVIWSLLLGTVFLFLASSFAFQYSPYCIDGPCGYKVGWPVPFGKLYSQQTDEPGLSGYADLIPKGTLHSGTTFNGTSLTILQVSGISGGYTYLNGFSLPTSQYWNVQQYSLLPFLINLAAWFVIMLLVFSAYKKYIKFNGSAVIVLSILYFLFSALALGWQFYQAKAEMYYNGSQFVPFLLMMLFYLISPLISVGIISSQVSRKSLLISSLIFPIPFVVYMLLEGNSLYNYLDIISSLFILYLIVVNFAPLSAYFVKNQKTENTV